MAHFAVAMLDGSHALSDGLFLPQNGGRKELHNFACSAVAHTDLDAQQPASLVPMCVDTGLDFRDPFHLHDEIRSPVTTPSLGWATSRAAVASARSSTACGHGGVPAHVGKDVVQLGRMVKTQGGSQERRAAR